MAKDPFQYIFRFCCDPGFNDVEEIEALNQYVDEADVDDMAIFANVEEINTGHMSFEEQDVYLAMMEQVRQLMARKGITISIVGVNCVGGAEKNMKELLTNYAGMSEDNYYSVSEVSKLPEVMRKDLEVPEIKDVNYVTFQPTFGTTHIITAGIDERDLPTLDGYYGVKAKEGAEVIIMGEYTPIYTQWQCGAGMVGTFACDLNGTWSREFINSDIGGELINNIIDSLFPT